MTIAHDVYIKVANVGGEVAGEVNMAYDAEGSTLREEVDGMLDEWASSLKEDGCLLQVDDVFGVHMNLVVYAPEEDFSYCDLILDAVRAILLPVLDRLCPGAEVLLVKDLIVF